MRGQIIAVNPAKIAKLLNRNHNFFRKFFQNPRFCIHLTSESTSTPISENYKISDEKRNTFFSTIEILKLFKINLDFFFAKHNLINPNGFGQIYCQS